MATSSPGFSLVETILGFFVVIIIGSAGWFILHSKQITYENSPIIPAATGPSLLTGLVAEGPVSPGPCQPNQNCSDAPVINHSMVIYSRVGGEVATTKTDNNGVYKVKLQPGEYRIKLEPAVGVGENAFVVTVGTNGTTFNISVDTGLR